MKNVLKGLVIGTMATGMMYAQATLPGAAPAAGAAPAGPSADEIKEIQAIQAKQVTNAAEATALMSAVTAFVAKFPNSTLNGYAFTIAGDAAQKTGNSAQTRFFFEKAIAADPNSDYAMVMLGADIAQNIKPNAMDRAAQVTRVNKLANDALALIEKRVKQPQENDQQFQAEKQADIGRAHMTLGLAAMADEKYEAAGKEFLIAGETDGMSLLRAGMAFNNGRKVDEAEAALNKFLAIPSLPDQYKKMAEDEKKRGQQIKNGK